MFVNIDTQTDAKTHRGRAKITGGVSLDNLVTMETHGKHNNNQCTNTHAYRDRA